LPDSGMDLRFEIWSWRFCRNFGQVNVNR
jgi:hypothetical protein